MPGVIALDAMGSDRAPKPEVEGAIQAARRFGTEDPMIDFIQQQLLPLDCIAQLGHIEERGDSRSRAGALLHMQRQRHEPEHVAECRDPDRGDEQADVAVA